MSASKGILSRGVRLLREGAKSASSRVAGVLLRKRTFSLLGIPAGLTSGIGPGEGAQRLIYPPQKLSITPPKSIEKNLYWRFRAILAGMEIPGDGILRVPGGTATQRGGNLNRSGKLITTFLQPIDGKSPQKSDLMRFSTKKFFPSIYHSQKPVVTLTAGWQGAFYHWVYEVLPRLHLVEKEGYPLDQVYVESVFPFQKESLELIGIEPSQMIPAQSYGAVTTPELVIPSIPLTPTDWGCRFLREKILPKLSPRPPLRLYVSRNDASRRRIINEDEVFALLKTYGFEKVQLSALPFKQQAELFQAAEVVVGPHGAGFSHIVFCKPRTPFLEIFAPAYFHPCYWQVSNRVNLDYYYLFGEGERYPDGVITNLDPDITVDIPKLQASLTLMGL